jgi:hypothetical protein
MDASHIRDHSLIRTTPWATSIELIQVTHIRRSKFFITREDSEATMTG